MKQAHEGHEDMSAQTMRRHYLMLILNLLISTIVMYLVMFEMIRGWSEFIQNVNFFYMALTMGVLMLLMMRSMYNNRTLNLVLYAVFTIVFVGALLAVRTQAGVGDGQFVRSMIPHHSGAILMCQEASLQDREIRDLCFGDTGIVNSQRREIEQMRGILARLQD